jgi:vancomycin resistance protein YoaR
MGQEATAMTVTTSTTPRRPAAAPERQRPLLLAAGVVGGVVLLFMLVLFALQATRAGALPGTWVGEADLGGLDGDELRDALTREADRRAAEPVTVTQGDITVEGTAGELGYALDVDATAESVLRRGRQVNPLSAMGDQLRAFGGRSDVAPVQSVDDGELIAFAERVATELDVPPVEGEVRFEGAEVVRVEPAAGRRTNTGALAEQARGLLLEPGPDQVTATLDDVPASTDLADLDRLEETARRAVSGPVSLTSGPNALTFSPEEIGRILRVERAADGTSSLIADVPTLEEVVGPEGDALTTEPVDASFRVANGAVEIIDGQPGVTYDPQAAGTQLVALATGEGPREAPLEGEALVEPERTREDAEALRITQQVSTFTTNHAAGEPRVTNIHRIADLIRGVVVEPGEVFSVNDFVGERTSANGFVNAPAIQDGEFVPSVGGGVSQFATTMFNAAFFGGYDILEHKPHSQYISRYPPGREATLSYPDVDLVIENNSPCGLLIDTSYTASSITVSFYGCQWVTVTEATGPRTNFRGPETIIRPPQPDEVVPPGGELVVQEGGGQGFDITVTRTRTFPDGTSDQQTYSANYVATPRIIARG